MFGLPDKPKGTQPWWDYAAPKENIGGYGSDISIRGLLHRSIAMKSLPLTDRTYVGVYNGSWEEVREALVLEDFSLCYHKQVYESTAKEYNLSPDSNSMELYSWQNGSVELEFDYSDNTKTLSVSVYTSDLGYFNKVREWCSKNLAPRKREGHVYIVSRPKPTSPLILHTLGKPDGEFISENYAPDVCNSFVDIVANIENPSPKGRLTIFHGPPGTGKTHLLRALSQKLLKSIVVFVPNSFLDDLGNPEFIEALLSHSVDGRSTVLLVEDADLIFRKRTVENTKALSSALNLTDGLMGDLMNVHIIGTTNIESIEIDAALKRPGRLFKDVVVGKLPTNQAAKVFKRLYPRRKFPAKFKDGATLAEIYNL